MWKQMQFTITLQLFSFHLVGLNVDYRLRTQHNVYEVLSFVQKTTKFYPYYHMVSQTTVSPNSLITIALKWITSNFANFFQKRPSVNKFSWTNHSPYSALWFPTEGALFSTYVIDKSVLSAAGYTQNNHDQNGFLKSTPQNKILDWLFKKNVVNYLHE